MLAWPVRNFVYLYPWAWIPEEGLAERSKRDNVHYDDWARRGLIELTPGNVTDWRFVTARIKQLATVFDIRQIGFDKYGARDIVADLEDDGINTVETRQGFLSMNAPCRRLNELVLSRHLVHSGHEVLRWNIDCTSVDQDAASNIKPIKPNRQKSTKRIDLTVAAVMAIDCVMKATETNIFSYSGLRSVG